MLHLCLNAIFLINAEEYMVECLPMDRGRVFYEGPLVEQVTLNHRVRGSSSSQPTTGCNGVAKTNTSSFNFRLSIKIESVYFGIARKL